MLNNIIYLTKLGNFDDVDLENFIQFIQKTFKNVEVKIKDTFTETDFAYDKNRNQYFAPLILEELKRYINEDNQDFLVSITDKDLYDYGLNFIFGEAQNNISIISISRFKPSKWQSQEEAKLLYERTQKTIIHEIGHMFGLKHCGDDKCVMFFSNWLENTDRKSKKFCSSCFKNLKL